MDRSDQTVPVTVGRYAIFDAIGSGGMATVHLGRLAGEEGFRRTVAIKRLRAQLVSEPEAVASFVDEARLAARIRHPNVVATIDIVTKDDEVFLVMEYVDGESLASLVRRCEARAERVPPAIAVAIVAGVLHGLHAAHEALSESGESLHLVHRDVSPQNVLVGVDGIARVLDFGVAKALGRQQTTRDGRIKGTLAYMAPEQLSGRGVTRRTDTFAAGILLWELLAGRRLFRAEDDAQTVTRVLFEPVLPPSQVCPQAPASLDAVVVRALERDPIRRFVSADEMAATLESALTPATAQSVSEWVRSMASEDLEERARRVREIEHRSMIDPSPPASDGARPESTKTSAAISSAAMRPRPPRVAVVDSSRVRLLAVAVTALVLVGLSAARIGRRPAQGAQASAIPSAAVSGPAVPTPSPSAASPSPAAELPVVTASVPPAPAPLPNASPARRTSGPRPALRQTAPNLPVGTARERLYSQD